MTKLKTPKRDQSAKQTSDKGGSKRQHSAVYMASRVRDTFVVPILYSINTLIKPLSSRTDLSGYERRVISN